jgi:hypothetical protein
LSSPGNLTGQTQDNRTGNTVIVFHRSKGRRGEGARGFMAVVVSHGIVDALSILSQVSVLIEPALVTALLGLTYIALVAVDSFFYSEITRLRPLLTPARLRADISEEEFV